MTTNYDWAAIQAEVYPVFDHFRLSDRERYACWQTVLAQPAHALPVYRAIARTLRPMSPCPYRRRR